FWVFIRISSNIAFSYPVNLAWFSGSAFPRQRDNHTAQYMSLRHFHCVTFRNTGIFSHLIVATRNLAFQLYYNVRRISRLCEPKGIVYLEENTAIFLSTAQISQVLPPPQS